MTLYYRPYICHKFVLIAAMLLMSVGVSVSIQTWHYEVCWCLSIHYAVDEVDDASLLSTHCCQLPTLPALPRSIWTQHCEGGMLLNMVKEERRY